MASILDRGDVSSSRMLHRHRMRWQLGVWALVPLAVWLLSRALLVRPAEAQLHAAQQELLAAQRAELEGSVTLEQARVAVAVMERRREALVADARRLKAAESTATQQIEALDKASRTRLSEAIGVP